MSRSCLLVPLLVLGPLACGDDAASEPADAAVDAAPDMPEQVVYPDDGGETSCARATSVECGAEITGDNAAGANWINMYMCTAIPNAGPEVYYSFSDEETKIVTVDLTVLDEAQDLDLFVLGQDCDAASCIDRSVNTGADGEQVRFAAVGEREYRIIVDGYVQPVSLGPGSAGASPFEMTVSCAKPACLPSPETVDCTTTELAGNNSQPGARDDLTTYGCGGDNQGPEYTYTFVAPIEGQVTVTLDIAHPSVANLDVFVLEDTGDGCSAVDCVGASRTRLDETLTFDVTYQTTYYIVVDGVDDEDRGDYLLSLECDGSIPPDGGPDAGPDGG